MKNLHLIISLRYKYSKKANGSSNIVKTGYLLSFRTSLKSRRIKKQTPRCIKFLKISFFYGLSTQLPRTNHAIDYQKLLLEQYLHPCDQDEVERVGVNRS
jgi:hypothetical protein